MKKLISLFLALCLGLGASALADGGAALPDASAADADNILPDAWAFFRGEITHSDKPMTNGKKVSFGLEEEDRQAVYEYMDLLQSGRFELTLTDTWEEDGSHKRVYYVFDYPGTGPDMEITRDLDDMNVSGDVIVVIDDWGYDLWCDLIIRFSDALTVVDTGDRCTDTELTDFYAELDSHTTGPMGSGASEPDSSSSGGSDSSESPAPTRRPDDDDDRRTPKPEQKCYKCHGDGDVDCSRCDGDGGKWVYDSVPNYSGHSYTTVRTWQSCSKCHGTGEMTCPICHGDGTY